MCIYMCIYIRKGMRIDMRIDMCTDMCMCTGRGQAVLHRAVELDEAPTLIDVCLDTCLGMWVDARFGMHVGMHGSHCFVF